MKTLRPLKSKKQFVVDSNFHPLKTRELKQHKYHLCGISRVTNSNVDYLFSPPYVVFYSSNDYDDIVSWANKMLREYRDVRQNPMENPGHIFLKVEGGRIFSVPEGRKKLYPVCHTTKECFFDKQ